jgi:hypothetical protein
MWQSMAGLYKVLPLKRELIWTLRRRNPGCYGRRARAMAAWFMGDFFSHERLLLSIVLCALLYPCYQEVQPMDLCYLRIMLIC